MENETVDFNNVIIDSGDLVGALQGLKSFVFDKFSSTDVERTDLSALQGLVACIEVMATKHANDLEKISS